MLLPAAMLRTHPIVAPDTGGPEPFGPGMLTKAPGATSLRTVRPLVWKLAVRVPTARSNAVLLPERNSDKSPSRRKRVNMVAHW